MDILACIESYAARSDRDVCDVELIESQSGVDAWSWCMATAVSLSGRLAWVETEEELDEAVRSFLERFKVDAITAEPARSCLPDPAPVPADVGNPFDLGEDVPSATRRRKKQSSLGIFIPIASIAVLAAIGGIGAAVYFAVRPRDNNLSSRTDVLLTPKPPPPRQIKITSRS